MPEFEEAKPINTKTDYELNSDTFSAPPKSNQQHIPTPPSPPSASKPRPVRRSRYKSERRPATSKPNPGPPREEPKPAPVNSGRGETASEESPEQESLESRHQDTRQKRPPRQSRPPRNNQNRNRRQPRDGNQEGESPIGQKNNQSERTGTDGRKGNRNNRNQNRIRSDQGGRTGNRGQRGHRHPARQQNQAGEPSNSGSSRISSDRQNASTPGKAPAKKSLIASMVSSVKGLFGVKEEEPKKEPYQPHRNRRPRRRKNYNQSKRPQGQGNRNNEQGDQVKSEGGPEKQFAKKRSRRRRRRRPNPEKNKTGSSPKPDKSTGDS